MFVVVCSLLVVGCVVRDVSVVVLRFGVCVFLRCLWCIVVSV